MHKMTSQNVLQPINCNVRTQDGSPLSKRPRRGDYSFSVKNENAQRWSLTSGPNELDILAEMGLGMLDSDDISDCRSEDDSCQPSCSRVNYEPNDTNPDLINLPGEYLSNSASNDSTRDSVQSATKEQTDVRKEMVRNVKTWENFCIYRRSSMINQDSKDWFNCLSDEIILMIFRWLPKIALTRCALVCKRWHRLSADETLWTRLDCSMKVLEPGALGHILSRQVIILKLSQSEIMEPPILPNVKAYSNDFTSKLMYLDLSMATISTNSLYELFKRCKRLRKLSLESCVVDDAVCTSIAKNEVLEVLNMTMVEGLTTKGIDAILSSCKQIKELNVAWTGLAVESLNHLCISLPKCLNRLNLSGCRKTLNILHITDIVKFCPHLRELDVSDGTGLTNEAISYITQLKELHFLALSRCYGIQCNFLKKLTVMSSLQYLDIHGGHIEQRELDDLQQTLGNRVQLNKFMFSSIARPTVGIKRSSIWGLRVRD